MTFITSNAGKAKYLTDYFHLSVYHLKLDLNEIQSLSLKEVVEDKARRAFEIVRSPVLVEDVSLTFTALKALPGPLIKWFLETLGTMVFVDFWMLLSIAVLLQKSSSLFATRTVCIISEDL
jgi:inosine triphosphate pyrophosphatase